MRVSAVNNYRLQKTNFKANSDTIAPAKPDSSADFNNKKKQILHIAASVFAFALTFGYFYIFCRERIVESFKKAIGKAN